MHAIDKLTTSVTLKNTTIAATRLINGRGIDPGFEIANTEKIENKQIKVYV